MKKSILAAALMVAASGAMADPFYLDIGTNFDAPVVAPGGDKECDTCTSMKDEMLFTYQSSTTIFDTVDDDAIGAGDMLTTDGGLAVGGFSIAGLTNNKITGFTPSESFGAESDNGYGGSNWQLAFSISGLGGVVTGVSGTGVPEFAYGPGVVEMFVTFDGVSFNNFMDIKVTGGGATGISTILTGAADFTAVDAGYNDLFHSGTKNCAGDDSFFAIWSNCGGVTDDLSIDFFASFDTNVFVSNFTPNDPTDPTAFSITSNHDGSATFAIPEPSTIMLMGSMALLGGGLSRRSRKA